MKKQILTFSAACITLTFFSCSKETPKTKALEQTGIEKNTASNTSADFKSDPLTANLEGWFTFDKTLKDKTGKLPDGSSTTRNVLYSTDRKGNANGALKLDSTYFVRLFQVVQQTHSSISVWLKYGNVVPYCPFIANDNGGIKIAQQNLTFSGLVCNPVPNFADSRDLGNGWHHIVVTYDGSFIRLYVDAAYVVPVSHPGSYGPYFTTYTVGMGINEHWRGYVDDLRFYSRTLVPSDVLALYNQ